MASLIMWSVTSWLFSPLSFPVLSPTRFGFHSGLRGRRTCQRRRRAESSNHPSSYKQDLPFEKDSFDAVYAVEATCHAPVIEGVYREAYRVLKPGGMFGTYEFGLSDMYDDDNATHRELRNKIELGNGIPHLNTPKECLDALDNVGFELVYHKDLGIPDEHNPVPWW